MLDRERTAEVDELGRRIPGWAEQRGDVRAVGLVGSWARGTSRPGSDVDLVVLTDNSALYTSDSKWAAELAAEIVETRSWGAITERRLALPSGLEVEVGIGSPSWAATTPVDPGTERVVREGFRVLYDPDGLLASLVAACAAQPNEPA